MGAKYPDWELGDRFLDMRSRWFTLIGEHWRDHQGRSLDYWRVERSHSVVILPIQNEQLILPPDQFRPGVGRTTLDFPGGRLPDGVSPDEAAEQIMKRELGVEEGAIAQLRPINTDGWIVNSSFSNQCLYGFVAHLSPDAPIPSEQVGYTFSVSRQGIQALLKQLSCLQCRALLLEWWMMDQTVL